MTIKERKDNIFHEYGTDIDTLNSRQLRILAVELDALADDLEDQEALINTMKEDMLRAIKNVARQYRENFDTIYLFGNDVDQIDEDDIDIDDDE